MAEAGPRARKRPLSRRIVFALVALVLALAAAETLARLAEWSRGSRAGAPVLPPKPDGAFRVLAFGGSTVEGWPVPRLGFLRQLGYWLEQLAPDRRPELINLGRAGHASRQVLEAVRASLAADPDLLILLCGHNEFLDRASEAASRRALAFGLAHAASVRWLAAAQRALAPRRRALDPAAERIEPYDRGSPDFARRVARYEANLDAVARLAHARGIPLVLATVPANLADWPPVHRQLEVEPGRAREIDAVEAALAGGRLDEADARLAAALGVHPEDAMLLFLRGKLEQRRGALDAARRSFERARELDPYPWRVLGRFNEIVRQRARANAAILADVEAALAAAAAGGLVGFELIADNAHPTPLGAALMARTILLALARHGVLVGPGPALPPAPEQLERYLASLGDAAERRRLYALQQLRSGVYAMKPPFFHYAIARRYFEAAQALAPDDWRIPANQASLLLLEGRGEEARAALARVLALGGSLADEDPDVPYLRIALERSGGAGTAR